MDEADRRGLWGEVDLHLLGEGTHSRLYERLGAHPGWQDGVAGTRCAVWAPNARRVVVVGDVNGWSDGHALAPVGESGVWAGFVGGLGVGQRYKYRITDAAGVVHDRADPVAFEAEMAPATASVVCDPRHAWGDARWMAERGSRQAHGRPISIYEVHLGSWQRVPQEGNRFLSYRELAPRLADHALAHGFTHVELMPVTEHPYYVSWGYQVTGYFAATRRYGTPEDLMFLVDHLHQRGLGVVLDWVPAHFPDDAHGLARFDGTALYEHADPRQGRHPDWQTCIFNYDRNEVRAFLLSSARWWLEVFHADGLRVDGVASMLYLDYSRPPGTWIPNLHGGRENLGAVRFLRELNVMVHQEVPGALTFAEESTSWPGVTHAVAEGGLGFDHKWDLGWMNDTLTHLRRDPVNRPWHTEELTFRAMYATSERFLLPLSHDEVVHGKGSLLGKMPGDAWQQRANLRLLLAWQAATPGKKLLFMGAEVGQRREWDLDGAIDLAAEGAGPVGALVGHLLRTYRDVPAMHEGDAAGDGFAWVDLSGVREGVLAFLRYGQDRARPVLCVFQFQPTVRTWDLGVPRGGRWREVVSTDAVEFGGTGVGNLGAVDATEEPRHGHPFTVRVRLPALGSVWLTPEG